MSGQAGTVGIRLFGGPSHGQEVHAVIGPDGRPPLTHSIVVDGELTDAAVYELQSTADGGWRYEYRPAPVDGDRDFAPEHSSATFAEEMPGGPEGHPEDDSPKGWAGAD